MKLECRWIDEENNNHRMRNLQFVIDSSIVDKLEGELQSLEVTNKKHQKKREEFGKYVNDTPRIRRSRLNASSLADKSAKAFKEISEEFLKDWVRGMDGAGIILRVTRQINGIYVVSLRSYITDFCVKYVRAEASYNIPEEYDELDVRELCQHLLEEIEDDIFDKLYGTHDENLKKVEYKLKSLLAVARRQEGKV